MKRALTLLLLLGILVGMGSVAAATPTNTTSCTLDNGHHTQQLNLPSHVSSTVAAHNSNVSCTSRRG